MSFTLKLELTDADQLFPLVKMNIASMGGHIMNLPQALPFVGISLDKTLDFGKHGQFRVMLYGGYNAKGLIGTEFNGIAITSESSKSVVKSAAGM